MVWLSSRMFAWHALHVLDILGNRYIGTQFDKITTRYDEYWEILSPPLFGQEKKPININIFGGTVSGTNRNRPWDKWDPSPGQNGTRPWDKPAFLCLTPQSNRHFVPFVPGTGGGLSLGRLSCKGREKNVYVFSVYCFFSCPLLSVYVDREFTYTSEYCFICHDLSPLGLRQVGLPVPNIIPPVGVVLLHLLCEVFMAILNEFLSIFLFFLWIISSVLAIFFGGDGRTWAIAARRGS